MYQGPGMHGDPEEHRNLRPLDMQSAVIPSLEGRARGIMMVCCPMAQLARQPLNREHLGVRR